MLQLLHGQWSSERGNGKTSGLLRRADHGMNGPLNFSNNDPGSSKGRLFIKTTIARPRVLPPWVSRTNDRASTAIRGKQGKIQEGKKLWSSCEKAEKERGVIAWHASEGVRKSRSSFYIVTYTMLDLLDFWNYYV